MVARTVFALGLAAAGGCSARAAHPVPIAVLVDGDRGAIGHLPPDAVAGLELREVPLPPPPPAPGDETTPIVINARQAYARGDFDQCRATLANVDVARVLVDGDRALASRALTLAAACEWASMAKADAEATGARLASFGLELPAQVVSPDVETMIGKAITAAGTAPHQKVVVGGVAGARLSIDGRDAGCAVPCTVDLGAGDHILAVHADGFMPASRQIRVPDTRAATLEQPAAPPDIAAQQWRARVGRGLSATDPTGALLLSKLTHAPRIAYVHGGVRLTGGIVVDGRLVATTSADRGHAPRLVRDLAYDGGILKRPSVWQRPWFWIAVTGGVAVIAAGIVAITYTPPIHTSGGF